MMNNELIVRVVSFSFHQTGFPTDNTGNNGGFVFDCRFLPNPGRELKFKQLTGRDMAVIEYFSQYHQVALFLNHVTAIIEDAVANYQERGFTNLMVCFGCTGGQHRSVYSAENIAIHLQEKGIQVELDHIELKKMGFI